MFREVDMDRTEQIRARAHQIWESEGSPDGREADHWSEAERQLRAEGALADDDRPDDMGLEEVARKPGTAGIGGSDNWTLTMRRRHLTCPTRRRSS
jgi:hypothetical protein